MEEDISNKTIVVLVVLTVVISVLSTLVVLNEVNNFKPTAINTQTKIQTQQQGKVSFTINQPTTTEATGKIIFDIQ
jgi:hypothetical protein